MNERERSPTAELWDKRKAADYLGIRPNSVRVFTFRRGIPVVARYTDEQGRSHALYLADDIRAHRPTVAG